METKANLFAVESESFITELFSTRYVHEDHVTVIGSIPEHQEYIDFNFNMLENCKWAIKFDSYVFLSGLTYNLAASLFGEGICTAEQTRQVIADMIQSKFGHDAVWDYDFILESINLDQEFKTAEDIDRLIKETGEMVKEFLENGQKEINCCDQLTCRE